MYTTVKLSSLSLLTTIIFRLYLQRIPSMVSWSNTSCPSHLVANHVERTSLVKNMSRRFNANLSASHDTASAALISLWEKPGITTCWPFGSPKMAPPIKKYFTRNNTNMESRCTVVANKKFMFRFWFYDHRIVTKLARNGPWMNRQNRWKTFSASMVRSF